MKLFIFNYNSSTFYRGRNLNLLFLRNILYYVHLEKILSCNTTI